MPDMICGPEGERVIRWMEESPKIFEGLRQILHDHDQCREAVGAAQAERARFEQHCEALREEVRQLQAELKRLQKERAESAQWFATMMQEAAARFPLAPPTA